MEMSKVESKCVHLGQLFHGRIEAYTLNDTRVSESILIPFRKKQFLQTVFSLLNQDGRKKDRRVEKNRTTTRIQQDTRHKTQDTTQLHNRVHDTRHKTQDTRHKTQHNTQHNIQHTRHNTPHNTQHTTHSTQHDIQHNTTHSTEHRTHRTTHDTTQNTQYNAQHNTREREESGRGRERDSLLKTVEARADDIPVDSRKRG